MSLPESGSTAWTEAAVIAAISSGELCGAPESHRSARRSSSSMPSRLRSLTLASNSSAVGRSCNSGRCPESSVSSSRETEMPVRESGRGATAATGPGIHPCVSFSATTRRAASAGAHDFPPIEISRYSSARASINCFRTSSSFLRASWCSLSSFFASISSEPASARDNRSAIEPTALSNCFRLSRSLSSTLTHSGRNSGTM